MSEILIADDHPLFREALHALVMRALGSSTQIHEAESIERLLVLIDSYPHADLLLLDLSMPGAKGFEALMHLRSQWPQLPVVVISAHEDPQSVQHCIHHGAAGFIPKSTDATELADALQAVLAGDTWFPALPAPTAPPHRIGELTPQQRKVLEMAAAGLLNKQIAHELGTSEATIKAHMTAILRKLGATNRTQAVSIFNRAGLPVASGP